MTGFRGSRGGPKGVESPLTAVFTFFEVVQELKEGRKGGREGGRAGERAVLQGLAEEEDRMEGRLLN